MTRFARSKGSKASNERVPEEATTWTEMKQQLLEQNKEIKENKKRKEIVNKREENYKKFLEERETEESKNVKWADFPGVTKAYKNDKDMKKVIKKMVKKPELKAQLDNTLDKTDTHEIKQIKKGKNSKVKKEAALVKIKESPKSNGPEKNKTKKLKVKKSSIVIAKKKTENLSAEDIKKIEKKKQKKIRQLEKRKKKIAETQAQKQAEDSKNSEKSDIKTNNNPLPKQNQRKFQKAQKPAKFKNNKEHHRKKPFLPNKMFINGKEIEIAYVDNFPVKKEDAERLKQLRKEMISKGLPRSEINIALKLERRRAEKAFAREKKKVCFHCRKSDHYLSECPDLSKDQVATSGCGICFKCGSTEHTHFECKVVRGDKFKFAQCFICNESGHIARQCPDNPKGLYPKGGACKVCGDVTHLKKDCPSYQEQQQSQEISVNIETLGNDNPDVLEDAGINKHVQESKRPNKIIKF